MSIRYQLRERFDFGTVGQQVRSALGLSHAPQEAPKSVRDRDDATGQTDASGNLFHCSSCGVVYIATAKQSCTTCETDVEQVRSTLSCR
ncbi:hypothetical protein [Natronolimnobius baerhuensis]|uniref:Uncharacterized protein n=1 Tax=Natronolimnobius baerhuensis TaxID=253108 RepID=A0A202E7Z6_9EURY|nr:hypothetical protein [Natronolimnobius baerhuensis]OVE84381.1 hypothetical protein B2G88_08175 [Natronolimnobius baerhuensis]